MEEQMSTILAISEVGLTEIDGTPCCRDIELGQRLGFSRAREIRKLVERNLAELQSFGPLRQHGAMVAIGSGAKREVQEYWLTEEQALLAAAISNAPHAPAVRAMLIKTFVAWRRGHLVPASDGAVTDISAEVRKVVGGIVKAVVHSELTHMIAEMLPNAVRAEIASSGYAVRHGKTAGQIWYAMGYPKLRITNWFGNRLAKFGCRIEGNGRGELGLMRARLFDPDKAEHWLKEGGGDLLVKQKIAERQGQGRLRLVPDKKP